MNVAEQIRGPLLSGEAVCLNVFDPDYEEERRLAIVPSACWGEPQASIMLSYEGGGCLFFDGSFALTEYDLMANGFSFAVAREVYAILANVFQKRRARYRKALGQSQEGNPRMLLQHNAEIENKTTRRHDEKNTAHSH